MDDGDRVLTWSADGTAKIWSLGSDLPLRVYRTNDRLTGAQVDRSESRVLTWSEFGWAYLWALDEEKPIRIFKHSVGVVGATFIGDQNRILTWGKDGYLRLWSTTGSEVPLRVFRHGEWVAGVILNEAETHFFSWGYGQKEHRGKQYDAKFWSLDKEEPLQLFDHEGYMNGAALSDDETKLFTWSADGKVMQWNLGAFDLDTLDPKQLVDYRQNIERRSDSIVTKDGVFGRSNESKRERFQPKK
jgi:WD40 repeat protein